MPQERSQVSVRALAMIAGGDKDQLIQGLEMVIKQLFMDLRRFEISTIDPLNTPFNPELHEAAATVLRDDVEANTVVEVRRRGYLLGAKLIRPAQVVVSAPDES